MCEFCEGTHGRSIESILGSGFDISIVAPDYEPAKIQADGKSPLKSYAIKVFYPEIDGLIPYDENSYYPIEFCPRCGRKL